MLSFGKLVVWQGEDHVQPAGPVPNLVPALVPAPIPEELCCSSLLFLRDILSDREFLVNSGASVSVFPGLKFTSINGVHLLRRTELRWYAVDLASFLYISPVEQIPRFILGVFSSLQFLFPCLGQIFFSISIFLSTSKVDGWFMLTVQSLLSLGLLQDLFQLSAVLLSSPTLREYRRF